MPKNSTDSPDLARKISYLIPETDYQNLALFTASLPGSPTPGPYMRDLAITESAKGKKLRARLDSKKG